MTDTNNQPPPSEEGSQPSEASLGVDPDTTEKPDPRVLEVFSNGQVHRWALKGSGYLITPEGILVVARGGQDIAGYAGNWAYRVLIGGK